MLVLGAVAAIAANTTAAAQTSSPPLLTMKPWFAERPNAPLMPSQSVTQTPRRPAQPAVPPAPTVVCGMTVMPANSKTDPAMVKTVTPSDTTRYSIRAVEPQVCRK